MSILLKNLYNESYISILSNNIRETYVNFNTRNFTNDIFDSNWNQKELKQRMKHIAEMLHKYLPNDYQKSIEILISVFKKMPIKFALENMIFQNFVQLYGINYFDISMNALEKFTQHSSSEFAIRTFLIREENKTLDVMKKWAQSSSTHTRRLACEGCRPRLPWAIALKSFINNPKKIIEILNILQNDNEKYVQKSIANSINDISKDNPNIAKDIAQKWYGTNIQKNWIVKHGCRTMLKNGDVDILKLFGFANPINISIKEVNIQKNVKMGNDLNFSFILKRNQNLGNLRIEFALTFVRMNNKTNRKVFNISQNNYRTNELKIIKKYSFRKINTRKYYTGNHKIELIVNGVVLNTQEFKLTK